MAACKALWAIHMEGGTCKEWGNPYSEASGTIYAVIPSNLSMKSSTLVDQPVGGSWKVGKRNKMDNELPIYVEGRADNMILLLSSPWLKKTPFTKAEPCFHLFQSLG